MNMSSVFIKRPVATTLLMVALLFFGIMAYQRLAVNDMPNIEFPFIVVTASLPGADPETMSVSVGKPLEKQLATISGIKNMTTTNKRGSTLVFIEFEFDKNINDAALDVQAALNVARRFMPDTLTVPPIMFKINPNSMPIFTVSLQSDTLTQQELTNYAETFVSDRLSMVNGVAQTQIGGARRAAVRIQLIPELMASKNISVEDVSDAVSRANTTIPTGSIEGEARVKNIKATGQIETAEEYSNIIITQRNGAPVRIKDVAQVIDGVEDDKSGSWINGKSGVTVRVVRQPDGNTVKVVEDIRKVLPEIQAQLPESIEMQIMEDNSTYINDAVKEVEFTLVLTICLVVLVIFMFLHDVKATVIPSLALPLSIVATYMLMWVMGYTIDNVSMLAMILIVSFVVDDAIVMLENIVRHREMGKGAFEAAMDGSKEIGFTILSMTISLGAVFIPLLFLPGMVGRYFNEFGAVAVIAIAFSGLISLSLTPMLCSVFLSEEHSYEHKTDWFSRAMEFAFEAMFNFYQKTLMMAVRHKFITFLFSLSLIFATVFLAGKVPTSFMPDMDTGSITVSTEAEESISYTALAKAQMELHDIIANDPAVESFISSAGGGGGGFTSNTNTGRISVKLKPASERDHQYVVIDRLKEKLSNSPTLNVYVAVNDGSGQAANRGQYQYTLVGSDQDILNQALLTIKEELKNVPHIQDVSTDVSLSNPEMVLTINRDKAASLGVSPLQIESVLFSAFSQRQVSTIYGDLRDYKVIMEVLPELQQSPSVLSSLYVRSTTGRMVPMDTLVDVSYDAGPIAIYHKGQFPAGTVFFNIERGSSLSDVLNEATALFDKITPAGVTGSYGGMATSFQDSMRDMILLIGISLAIIYIVLGVLYESFIHPLTILAGLPSAAFGAFFALWIFGSQLDMVAMIGLIVLIGIVKKNAIMMIDFALEAERRDHSSPEDAIVAGCLIRFRPIMMTTMAAILGVMPLALGVGETGADMRRPLGLCVGGGLIFSQVVTLYITPVYYIYLDKFGSFVTRSINKLRKVEA